jgi:lactose/L-arabinose transport system substrate-binding protein
MGHSDLHDRVAADCAAGGTDMPDVAIVENQEAELLWNRFPECFADLKPLGYTAYADKFPAFKQTELKVADKVFAMPWDSGPVMLFYRRDLYQKAGVTAGTLATWDDFIAAGKKLSAATGGKVKMATMGKGSDDEWFRMIAVQNGCFYFSTDGGAVTINQPGCVEALAKVKDIWDAGILDVGGWDEQIQYDKASDAASQLYGGWYEGTIRSNDPDQSGQWGVIPMPALKAGGNRASNIGGSSLAIASSSSNKAAAWAFVSYALGTDAGQISMMKYRGLIPSLLSTVDDPYVQEPQPYWGNQKVWADMLATLPKIPPYNPTAYFTDARGIMKVVLNDYLDGRYKSAKEALDAAAKQIADASGLPVKN